MNSKTCLTHEKEQIYRFDAERQNGSDLGSPLVIPDPHRGNSRSLGHLWAQDWPQSVACLREHTFIVASADGDVGDDSVAGKKSRHKRLQSCSSSFA